MEIIESRDPQNRGSLIFRLLFRILVLVISSTYLGISSFSHISMLIWCGNLRFSAWDMISFNWNDESIGIIDWKNCPFYVAGT